MGALEKRVKALGLEEAAKANKVKNDAKRAKAKEWQGKSASEKSKMTKAELVELIEELTQ